MAANKSSATGGNDKRTAVRQMFSEIAPRYDLLNGLMSLSMHHRWREAAVQTLNLRPGDTAIDVCCGTGDFMVPLFDRVTQNGFVMGLDFCLPMLEQALQKLASKRLVLGDACRLSVQSNCSDAVSIGWGIRNVPDIDAAHREVLRILKSGGRFVSLDMAKPKNPVLRACSTLIFRTFVPLLGRLFGKKSAYTYLPESTQQFMSRVELKASMEKAGFVDVEHRDFMFGNICMHFGRKP